MSLVHSLIQPIHIDCQSVCLAVARPANLQFLVTGERLDSDGDAIDADILEGAEEVGVDVDGRIHLQSDFRIILQEAPWPEEGAI